MARKDVKKKMATKAIDGNTTAAVEMALKARKEEDLELFMAALAGLLLAPSDDPRKGLVSVMIAMFSSSYEPLWQSSMWEAIK